MHKVNQKQLHNAWGFELYGTLDRYYGGHLAYAQQFDNS